MLSIAEQCISLHQNKHLENYVFIMNMFLRMCKNSAGTIIMWYASSLLPILQKVVTAKYLAHTFQFI